MPDHQGWKRSPADAASMGRLVWYGSTWEMLREKDQRQLSVMPR
jgi:hypothetical protein